MVTVRVIGRLRVRVTVDVGYLPPLLQHLPPPISDFPVYPVGH